MLSNFQFFFTGTVSSKFAVMRSIKIP